MQKIIKENVKEIVIALAIFACVMLILGAITLNAAETNTTEDGNFEYTVLSDGTIEITKYIGTETEVTIPTTIEGKTVTRIGIHAFSGCSSLTSIEIPEGVTSISNWAFEGCSNLTSINIPEGVIHLGQGIFSGCSSLTSIELPKGVTEIESYAFSGCSSLTNIEIPEGVTSIGSQAFRECSSLTSIEIPEGVIHLGQGIFSGCSSLTSIEIPEGVTSIEGSVFSGCSSLTSIEIPEGVISIGYEAFRGCSSLTSIEIPEGVTSIGYEAFRGCSSLTSINIPEGVKEIENRTFYSCNNLTEITMLSGVTSIGYQAFLECTSLTEIKIPSSVTNIATQSFEGCIGITEITIPSSVISIGVGAFHDCSSLTKIIIPEGVTSIGTNAFLGCSNLTIYCRSNSTAKEYAINNNISYIIDDEAPVVESVTGNPTEWTNKNVTLTINRATDTIVGLADMPYSFDGGETWQKDNTKTYKKNTDGIIIKVRDILGNIYTNEVINISKIDKENSVIKGITGNPTGWTEDNVTLTINAEDNLSGFGEDAYSFDGGTTWQKENTKTYEKNTNGVVIKIKDKAGNITEYQETINITKIRKATKIEVTEMPEKVEYDANENFDSAGMKVKVTYDNGNTEETTNYTVINGTNLTCKVEKIEIQYNKNTDITTEISIFVSHVEITDSKVEATCTKTGLTEGKHCSVCNKVLVVQKTVKEIGHNYENGECTRCGEEEPKIKVETEKYKIGENQITKIGVKTTVNKLLKGIKTNVEEIKIKTKDNKEVLESEIVGTGMKLELKLGTETKTFLLFVTGDVDGDGDAKLSDMTILNKYRLHKRTLEGEALVAADVTGDGVVDIKDIVKINRYRLHKIAEF